MASRATIYDASAAYQEAGIPLVILAGKEYGSGSSRDWAAKGTALLGVRAVIAETYERIHRSNLIGMGVLPLQYPAGQNAESLGLAGTETFSITGVEALNEGGIPKTVTVTVTGEDGSESSFEARRAHRHPRRGRLLPQRRHPAVRAALARRLTTQATPRTWVKIVAWTTIFTHVRVTGQPGKSGLSRTTSPTTTTAGFSTPTAAARAGDVAQRAEGDPLVGGEPALDDRHRARCRAAGIQQ